MKPGFSGVSGLHYLHLLLIPQIGVAVGTHPLYTLCAIYSGAEQQRRAGARRANVALSADPQKPVQQWRNNDVSIKRHPPF